MDLSEIGNFCCHLIVIVSRYETKFMKWKYIFDAYNEINIRILLFQGFNEIVTNSEVFQFLYLLEGSLSSINVLALNFYINVKISKNGMLAFLFLLFITLNTEYDLSIFFIICSKCH